MPESVSPNYRAVVETMVKKQGIKIDLLPVNRESGVVDLSSLTQFEGEDFAALVIPQPNFFGCLEEVDQLTDWAHGQGALVVGVVNPVALALLNPPGQWGDKGADIACGEGQPLGIPLSSGGPFFGFLCCVKQHMRQLPGRIVGRTKDVDGKPGFVLTLQAREQHIRRSKATSNICTNQGLMTTAATIHLALLGPDGLRDVALKSHENMQLLVAKLTSLTGVKQLFSQPFFHELVVQLDRPVAPILEKLAAEGIEAGLALENDFSHLPDTLLICTTETKSAADLDRMVTRFAAAME